MIVRQSLHVIVRCTIRRQWRLEDRFGQRGSGKRPHGEKREPAEKLDHSQFGHDGRHALDEVQNLRQSRPFSSILFLTCSQHFGGIFRGREHRHQYAGQKDGRTDGERHVDTLRQLSCTCLVGHAQLSHKPRQIRGNPRANADDEGLQHKAVAPLRLWQFVCDQGPERLHAHIDAGIEHPQESCSHPQFTAVGHKKQRHRTENCTNQKEGPAPPPPRVPRVVTEVPNDGLHQKARQRGGNPKHRNLILARTQGLKNS